MERQFSGPEGRVEVETRGGQAIFRACRPLTGPGLWKAWLVGERGRYLLGTLIPEGESLRLGRTVPVAQLERCGAWPPVGAEILRQGAQPQTTDAVPRGWRREHCPGALTPDPLLSRCLSGQEALYRTWEEGFLLALPWQTDRPFPLTPLFCLGRWAELEGKSYVLFSFDFQGFPALSEKEKNFLKSI